MTYESHPSLQRSRRAARITIDPEAIVANWRWFDRISGAAACAAVVKADAYGLGAEMAARALAQAGARIFFTATPAEGRHVRQTVGLGPEIYVLNGPTAEDAEGFAQAALIPVLNSLQQIELWNARGPAALHIDTGMNRLGVPLPDVGQAGFMLRQTPLKLIMSHLACASTVDHEMNDRQRTRFLEALPTLPKAALSLAATAGAQLSSDYHFDMIRPGLGLYGSGGLDKFNPPLAIAARITAPILQIREVPAGETFGYGATQRAKAPMRTATIAIGYADGFLRSFAGAGYGVLNGAKLGLLGRVSMDLVILDVTDAPNAKAGDEVEFLGEAAKLDDLAHVAGTAPYEILTTFAGTVRRAQ